MAGKDEERQALHPSLRQKFHTHFAAATHFIDDNIRIIQVNIHYLYLLNAWSETGILVRKDTPHAQPTAVLASPALPFACFHSLQLFPYPQFISLVFIWKYLLIYTEYNIRNKHAHFQFMLYHLVLLFKLFKMENRYCLVPCELFQFLLVVRYVSFFFCPYENQWRRVPADQYHNAVENENNDSCWYCCWYFAFHSYFNDRNEYINDEISLIFYSYQSFFYIVAIIYTFLNRLLRSLFPYFIGKFPCLRL